MYRIILSLVFIALSSVICHGQSDDYKYEVGVQLTTLSGRGYPPLDSNLAGGIRLGYNLMKNFGIEAELNGFPKSGNLNQNIFQGQFGVKAGISWKKFGFFAKVRPGFVRVGQDQFIYRPVIRTVTGGPNFATYTYTGYDLAGINRSVNTNFSTDLGGIIEFRPAKRIFLRLDIGDTVMRDKREQSIFLPASFNTTFPTISPLDKPSTVITHNIQTSIGVGMRF